MYEIGIKSKQRHRVIDVSSPPTFSFRQERIKIFFARSAQKFFSKTKICSTADMEDIHLNFSNLIMINIYSDTDYHNDAIDRYITINSFYIISIQLITVKLRFISLFSPLINPRFISIQYNEWQH